eukprot:183733-Ditylum_brightwellii.AAC.1
MFGNKISTIIQHPDPKTMNEKYYEAFTGGFKTTEKPGFDSHIDVLNSRYNEGYAYVMVMLQ